MNVGAALKTFWDNVTNHVDPEALFKDIVTKGLTHLEDRVKALEARLSPPEQAAGVSPSPVAAASPAVAPGGPTAAAPAASNDAQTAPATEAQAPGNSAGKGEGEHQSSAASSDQPTADTK